MRRNPSSAAAPKSQAKVVAVLGPTNTGKTHLAMERMLGHASGMIGFPLRLLARENYDRAVAIKGPRSVALITGEEKIVPAEARYFLCTVESMPLARSVAFLGVDEIQMCADPDRGHVFTDRLLHARGAVETMFMGAATVRPLLRRLVPGAEVMTRPRFSRLSFAGHRKLQRLPPRSAVVAFTAADVYAIAELIRRQRGGAAVVLGALSPRTRNAQVAMYQAGEVDYLVATDAIGMGLNMNIGHVAFAATRKFDGRNVRALAPAELAQVAGRAGRHMNDGTFGATAEVDGFSADVIDRIESHSFDPLQHVFWRNDRLLYTSVEALRRSLARVPDRPGLIRVGEAEDEQVLAALARDPEVARSARTPDTVRLLWEVCQIPDFRKVMSEAHARLLAHIFRFLAAADGRPGDNRGGRLPTDWIAKQVDRLDRVDGDIDTLMQRIAGIRTWTYVSYRGDWVEAAGHWQERTRAIEDKLSDALHERLMQRFVDRRTSVLYGRLKERRELIGAVTGGGDVVVEGERVGTLEGFRFRPDAEVAGVGAGGPHTAAKAVTAAAQRVLRSELAKRVRHLESDRDEAFSLMPGGEIAWNGAPVARLVAGHDILSPHVEPVAVDLLEADPRERVRRRLVLWLRSHLQQRLRPLFEARHPALPKSVRGLAFLAAEALGSVPRQRASAQIAALDRDDHAALRRLGLRIGQESVYFPSLIKPDAILLRALLWSIHRQTPVPAVPPPGRVSLSLDAATPAGFYEAAGFRRLGPLAVRIDMVERLAARARALAKDGDFTAGKELSSMIGCTAAALKDVLADLGYGSRTGDGGAVTFYRHRRQARPKSSRGKQRRSDPRLARPGEHSPFARLRDLTSEP